MKVRDDDFLLINLYNVNKVYDLLNNLSTFCKYLHCKNIIFGGDFNIFFSVIHEERCINSKTKNKFVSNILFVLKKL